MLEKAASVWHAVLGGFWRVCPTHAQRNILCQFASRDQTFWRVATDHWTKHHHGRTVCLCGHVEKFPSLPGKRTSNELVSSAIEDDPGVFWRAKWSRSNQLYLIHGPENIRFWGFRLEPADVRRIPVEVMKYAKLAALKVIDKYDAPTHRRDLQQFEVDTAIPTCHLWSIHQSKLGAVEQGPSDFRHLQLVLFSTQQRVTWNQANIREHLVPKNDQCRFFDSGQPGWSLWPNGVRQPRYYPPFSAAGHGELGLSLTGLGPAVFRPEIPAAYPRMNEELQKHLLKVLLSYMKQNQSITSFHTPTIVNFCLRCINGRIPDFLFNEIIKSIPLWRINSLKTVLVDLTENKRIHQSQLQMIITRDSASDLPTSRWEALCHSQRTTADILCPPHGFTRLLPWTNLWPTNWCGSTWTSSTIWTKRLFFRSPGFSPSFDTIFRTSWMSLSSWFWMVPKTSRWVLGIRYWSLFIGRLCP